MCGIDLPGARSKVAREAAGVGWELAAGTVAG